MHDLNDLDSKISSKEELATKGGGDLYTPMEADDYVALIVDTRIIPKQDYRKSPSDPIKYHPEYKIVAMCYSLKGGGTMRKIKNDEGIKQEVKPFEHWFMIDVNPAKFGFKQDKVTPSLSRGFLAYLLDKDVTDEFTFKANVILDPDYNIVSDQKIIDKYLKEVFDENEPQELRSKGYTHFKDFRQFIGRYIGVTTEIEESKKTGKSYEKVTKFGKLPGNFTPPSQQEVDEAIRKYHEVMAKKKEKNVNKGDNSNQTSINNNVGEMTLDDVPF